MNILQRFNEIANEEFVRVYYEFYEIDQTHLESHLKTDPKFIEQYFFNNGIKSTKYIIDKLEKETKEHTLCDIDDSSTEEELK